MDIIELAREIGRELQKDERYLNMRLSLIHISGAPSAGWR